MQTLSANEWNNCYAIQAIELYLPFAPDVDSFQSMFHLSSKVLDSPKLHENKPTVSENVVYITGFKISTERINLLFPSLLQSNAYVYIVLRCLT